MVNSSDFSNGTADSIMLTQLVLLYGLVRGNPMGHMTPYSPEAERMLFRLITVQEWDFLKMAIHPASLKWLSQQDEIMEPLLNQILHFCRLYSTDTTQISLRTSKIQTIDIFMLARLVVSGDNNMALLLVSLLKQVQEDCSQEDVISIVNVIAGILDIFPDASNKFCPHGISGTIRNVYSSVCSSSEIIKLCTLLVFKILSAANHRILSEDRDWFAITVKVIHSCDMNMPVYKKAKLIDIHCSHLGSLVERYCIRYLDTTSSIDAGKDFYTEPKLIDI